MSLSHVVAGIAGLAIVAQGALAVAQGTTSSCLHRPPGSRGEDDFMARCIKCGKCVQACPHRILHVAGLDKGAAAGTPYIDAREGACRLCDDFPCVEACPTQALRNVTSRLSASMGYAQIDENVCIAFKGYRCEVCYRVCPEIDKAITIENESIEGDDRHVKFIPVIHKHYCVGCGLCVERCAVDEPRVAISIVPLSSSAYVTGQGQGKGDGSGEGAGEGSGEGAGNGEGKHDGSGQGRGNGTGQGKNRQ